MTGSTHNFLFHFQLLDQKFAKEWGLSDDEEYDDIEEEEEKAGEGAEERQEEELEELLSLIDTLYCVACNKVFKTEKSWVILYIADQRNDLLRSYLNLHYLRLFIEYRTVNTVLLLTIILVRIPTFPYFH